MANSSRPSKSSQSTAQNKRLLQRLERHPELARQLEAILDTAENTDATADEIEQLLAKQLRKLGSTTTECWGSDTEEAAAQQFNEENPGAHYRKKKR